MSKVIYGALAIIYKIENDEYKFLLLKHEKGFWTFPGGVHENRDTTLDDTLIRELKEEIGLAVNKGTLIDTELVNKFIYDSKKIEREGKKGETHFYLIKLSGNELLSSWDKIVEHGWFSKEEIIKLLPFEDEKNIFMKAIKLL